MKGTLTPLLFGQQYPLGMVGLACAGKVVRGTMFRTDVVEPAAIDMAPADDT